MHRDMPLVAEDTPDLISMSGMREDGWSFGWSADGDPKLTRGDEQIKLKVVGGVPHMIASATVSDEPGMFTGIRPSERAQATSQTPEHSIDERGRVIPSGDGVTEADRMFRAFCLQQREGNDREAARRGAGGARG